VGFFVCEMIGQFINIPLKIWQGENQLLFDDECAEFKSSQIEDIDSL